MPHSVAKEEIKKEEISTRFKCELYYEFIKGASYITFRPNVYAKTRKELKKEIRNKIMSLTDAKPETMRITTIEEIWIGAKKKQEIINYYYSVEEFEESDN